MGAIHRLLSLACSTMLTTTARVRARLTAAPPPIGTGFLLPLLLAALGFMAETPHAMADVVYLHSQTINTTAFFEQWGGSSSSSYHKLNVDETLTNYARGGDFTNRTTKDYLHTITYVTEPAADESLARSWEVGTNVAVAPWSGSGLGTSTLEERQRIVHDFWFDGMLVTNHVVTNLTTLNTNYTVSFDDGSGDLGWPVGTWSWGDAAGETNSFTWVYTLTTNSGGAGSVLRLATDAAADGSASTLFCLTGEVVSYDYAPYLFSVPPTNWTLAGLAPDALGRVFKVLPNNTNDLDVTVAKATNAAFQGMNVKVYPARVELGIQWKGATDTNWSSGDLYVLKGTTVDFRVSTSVTNVTWPTGLPTWSNTSNGVTQITITFDTVSSTSTGQCVTATAGSTAKVQVVVFDYEVKFQPQGAGIFTGRATYPTKFGVGENVNYIAKSDPAGLTAANMGGISWSATGMSTATPEGDRSVTNLASLQAGAFAETNTVIGMIAGGISAGAARTNQFSVVRPTNSILQDLLFFLDADETHDAGFLHAWTNVGHTANTMSCVKRASYFLEPRDVSFHGIKVREGNGPTTWDGGLPARTNALVLTNSAGGNVTNFTLILPANTNDHPASDWQDVSHPICQTNLNVEPNYWGTDTFGQPGYPEIPGYLPFPAAHVSQIVGTCSVTIAIEFKLNTTIYSITDALFQMEIYTNGRTTIRKAGSGPPHTKDHADPYSPE